MKQITKSLLEKYNRPDGLIVVSSYPERGKIYSAHVGGIASFAKNTVLSFKNRPVVVIAEILDKEKIYEENGVLVIRCFRRNDPNLWNTVLSVLAGFSVIQNVMVEYDFALYGDIPTSARLIPFLANLRTMGRKAHVVLHSGVTDVGPLSGHLGLTNSTIDQAKTAAFNVSFRSFYRLVGLLATTVITTEYAISDKLSRYIPKHKLVCIPHGVDTHLHAVSKDTAKKKLGIKLNETVVLYFGFINWYKGADMFVDTFKNISRLLGKKTHFILAGGESATLNHKDYYKRFFAQVFQTVDESKTMRITGFVKQQDIATYFSAADLVVFPYRAFMSASGPLSLAYTYNKPFIVSQALLPMFDAPDTRGALARAGLTKENITFPLSPLGCKKAAIKVLRNGIKEKMVRLTCEMARVRDWDTIGAQYESVLFAPALKRLAASLAYATR